MALTKDSDFDIRYSREEDFPFLHKWIGAEEDRRWYPVSSDQEVENMARNWIGFHRYGASLTATYKEEVAGIATLFLMPYRKVIHHCLVYFVVNPEMRRQGLGTALIKNLNHLGKSYFRFDWMNAEVFEGCPAIPLLEKSGYEIVVTQKKFVKEGDGNYLARHLYQMNFKEFADGK